MNTPQHLAHSLHYWRHDSDFYAPDTVVLGIDIGIEGIGITIRKGLQWVYSKTLLVELPQAEALAERRAYRASRHARKNRKKRMARLKKLFAAHGLPWVNDDIMSRSDPFKLRYRAINGKLASREALSICIRSCVLRRGYDYFAMNDDDAANHETEGMAEMPWGTGNSLSDALKWLDSAYVDADMAEYLTSLTPLLTHNSKELDEKQAAAWAERIRARHSVAEQEGIPAMLERYVHHQINDRKARGKNYPRSHVEAHLRCIIERHRDLIPNAAAFEAALFRPCKTRQDKEQAIFHYNRKTPAEATRHFAKKVKRCPWCSCFNLPETPCGTAGDPAIRLWKLLDFISVRTFELQAGKLPAYRALLPESVVQELAGLISAPPPRLDLKAFINTALKKHQLKLSPTDWNKAQLVQLKDIVAPSAILRMKRASMSAAAAQALAELTTDHGRCYAPEFIEARKKASQYYTQRQEIETTGGIYPQVSTLLGTLKKRKANQPPEFATIGFLQRLFSSEEIRRQLSGKTVPDYCIVECIRSASTDAKQAAKLQKEQQKRRQAREKSAAAWGKEHCSAADLLRMRLFEEQGGSPTTPAKCPFTGAELAPADLFTAKLQLAHLYPDSRGGLYMADNLVLTTAEVNHDMGNRTPFEAAQAQLPGWYSWTEMGKAIKSFHWREEKEKIFSFVPTAEESFPNFNNTTRTAQLARELRRMVALWMGIMHDSEALRIRIGNPCGVYTAAARRSFLGPDYVKDRSDNRHHRIDAAVMTCLPPTGMNDALYRGIFYTERLSKNRRLMCIAGLPTPDFTPLLHDGLECAIVKIASRSKYKSLGDSTFWGISANGITHQRTPLSPDKVKSAAELYDILNRMGIRPANIPSEKKLEAWLINAQAATKADQSTPIKPLRLNNGTPIRNIWKFSSKGNLDKSPLGWSGIITSRGAFDQLRSLTSSNDRLELWIAWNPKKKRWEYYRKLIPTRAALAGLKRMGLPWRGTTGAPAYLLTLLHEQKARDLHSLISGTLPPHAVRIASVRKGDVYQLNFALDPEYIKKLQKAQGTVDMSLHPATLLTWGTVTAIRSDMVIACKSLIYKDRKLLNLCSAGTLAQALGLPENAADYAQALGLTPPA